MAIGWMYHHFTITVTTAQNIGMIDSGCLSGTAFDWLRPVTQNSFGSQWSQVFSLYTWVQLVDPWKLI